MSDRIAFALGKVLNRDHYGFDTQTITAPMDDHYPVKPDRDTLSKWLFRVKKWRVAGSFAMAGSNAFSGAGMTLSGSYNLIAPSICYHPGGIGFFKFVSTREHDLIPGFNQGAFVSASVDNGTGHINAPSFSSSSVVFAPPTVGSSPVGSGTMSLSASSSGGGAHPILLDKVGVGVSLFLTGFPVGWNVTEGPAPKLELSMAMEVTLTPPFMSLTHSTFHIVADSRVSLGSTIEPDSFLDGFNVPIKSNIVLNVGDSLSSHTVSPMTITPIEFWTFKNRLGQDVYDPTTGAQINDPFA